jgi:hypothetical protein
MNSLKHSFQMPEKPEVRGTHLANKEDEVLGVRDCDPKAD